MLIIIFWPSLDVPEEDDESLTPDDPDPIVDVRLVVYEPGPMDDVLEPYELDPVLAEADPYDTELPDADPDPLVYT